MGRYDLALIGFGGVNRALAELISQRGHRMAGDLGFTLRVVAITDLRAGSLVDTDGIDLAPLTAVSSAAPAARRPRPAPPGRRASVPAGMTLIGRYFRTALFHATPGRRRVQPWGFARTGRPGSAQAESSPRTATPAQRGKFAPA